MYATDVLQPGNSALQADLSIEDWLAVLLQGALAGIISVIGLFAIFVLTRKHERDRDATAAERQEAIRRQERTAQSVTAVVAVAHELGGSGNVEVTDILNRPALHAIARELLLFSAREGLDHPMVADWAYEESRVIVGYAVDSNTHFAAPSWEVGRIVRMLMSWSRGKLADEAFLATTEQLRRDGSEEET